MWMLYGSLGQSPGGSSRGRAPRQGVRGAKSPLKLNAFLHYHNLKSRPICSEICFCKTKRFRRTFGRHDYDPHWPVSQCMSNGFVMTIGALH